MPDRLDRWLAHNLGISRRDTTRLFRRGLVRDERGEALRGDTRVDADALPQVVVVDGEAMTLRARMDLVLHKPIGCVTALRDAIHPTAFRCVEDAPLADDLRAVGRLDRDTSGLLPWTTDGALLHRMTHPRYAVPRTYHAALRSDPMPLPAEGIELDDGHRPTITALRVETVAQMHPGLAPAPTAQSHASITIVGGKFHEVRRIFAALETEVLSLCRVQFGPVQLPRELAAGQWTPVDLPAAFP